MSWEIKITPINIGKKEVSVSATRTDGEDVFTTTTTGILDTAPHKLEILNAIWSDWQNYLTKQTLIASMIGQMEADGKANLEARE